MHTMYIKWNIEDVRFYNTTRPYTELGYMLGSQAEQMLQVIHTQNIKPYWNFSLNYRLINSKGFFQNLINNHNNYLVTSWYQAPKKRYNNYFVLLYNKIQAQQNGGILSDTLLNSLGYLANRFGIPTKIGGSAYPTNNFSTALFTGHIYREFNILMRQQYDLGRKDSIVTDSTVIPLFFPRLRFEHSFTLGTYNYSYLDYPTGGSSTQLNQPDTNYYISTYKLHLTNDSLLLKDSWTEVNNDFSIYQFPDAKNLQQYIKVGADLQLLHGQFSRMDNDTFTRTSLSIYNIMGHGEYRNRSKNQKWDILAAGNFYFSGYNGGDYHGYISLQRLISKSIGSLKIGFENANQTPPFIYDSRSSFYLDNPAKHFTKQNTLHFFGYIIQPKGGLQLSADYYLLSNYLYLNGYYQLQQESALFNVLRINALKTFRISKHWRLAAEVYVQQKTGNVQLNIPLVFTRNRLMYEGNLGFRNLNIAFGTEIRYNTPYQADNFSPVLGQFFYQDTTTINNRPDISAFLQFRIKGFKAYIRAENLNSAQFTNGGFGFTHNNFAAVNYPLPGMLIRVGIFWSFVN